MSLKRIENFSLESFDFNANTSQGSPAALSDSQYYGLGVACPVDDIWKTETLFSAKIQALMIFRIKSAKGTL